jgi:hypothetical protein
MPATPGQAANTRGAYPLTTTPSPASPWLSLQPVSPSRRLHSADVTRVDAEGRFKVFPPPGRRGAGGGEPSSWTRHSRPFPSDKGGRREGR